MKTQLISLILLVVLSHSLSAQRIGYQEIDPDNVSTWRADSPEAYQGVYHFGESETEWELSLIFAEGQCYGQISSGNWNAEGNWVVNYTNLKNTELQDNWLFSDQINGEFVMYYNESVLMKGFKLDNSNDDPGGKGLYEIGLQHYPIEQYFDGRFIQASLRALKPEELQKMSAYELKIMRNEIYARYGYRFIPGGAMDKYFSDQTWYRAKHDDVSSFLSDLEIKNIRIIQKAEREK
jgi:hypothetical protein